MSLFARLGMVPSPGEAVRGGVGLTLQSGRRRHFIRAKDQMFSLMREGW